MKLAEALQERADLNRRIEQLRARLTSNALVQEGEKPAEDPAALLEELDGCVVRLEELIRRINATNCAAAVGGETLTALIARKDCLQLRLAAYRELINEASQTARRATRTEIKIFSTVDVAALQKTADALSRQYRELDNRLQETNWTTELL
jgi:chromosome segregation ATPase